MPFIRSISGIRATMGDSLVPSVLSNYVAAYSMLLPEGTIVVGRDGRPSGYWITKIVVGTLLSLGRQVDVLGIVPTPTVQLMTEKTDAVGGISITASHNPGEWNGLKFLNGDGVFLDAKANEKLFSLVDNNQIAFPQELPEISREVWVNNADQSHVDAILNMPVLDELTITKIAQSKLRFVVDAVNASGSLFVPKLLDTLGIECIELYCDGSGVFPHTPEPLEVNLKDLKEAVLEHKATAGIAVDPDADRLVMIDEQGNAIGEEKTIAIAVKALLEHKRITGEDTNGLIITVNLSTSRMVDDVASEYGASVMRAPVGEINVVSEMKKNKSIIGGEGSGGVIYPECHYGRDSLVGIAMLSTLLINGKQLSDISAEIKSYHIIKVKQSFQGDIKSLIKKIVDSGYYSNGNINIDDGIRVDYNDSWVQLRASNTEPIVRIISEARTKTQAENLINDMKSHL